jgi:hypothetical protein
MAVFADTAYDAVKDVAKSWGLDPIYLVATPMADEQPQGDTDSGSEERTWTIADGLDRVAGTVQARSRDEALRIFGSTNNIDTRYYTAVDIGDSPAIGQATNATGNYQLVNSNRSIDTRMNNVTREVALQTARNMEQEYGLENGSIHVTRINNQSQSTTGAAGHNWRIYDVQNPDLFTVVAADSRTNAVERWAYVNPERPAVMVDAVPDEGAMKYEFTIAQQAVNPDPLSDSDRFIYPAELYRQRTGRDMPVRRVWATNKEQAISKARTFFPRDFDTIPEEWLKINVVGI